MKSLITGVNGFVGTHLTAHLSAESDKELFGLSGVPLDQCRHLEAYPVALEFIDLRDKDAVQATLAKIRPHFIFHLAAQAFVPASFEDPWYTLENNIKSQLNIFQSILDLDLDCRILVISSAEIYGKTKPHENPITEMQPLRPVNPYSVSKVAQDMLAYQYHQSHGLPALRARAFNHIGPGQSPRFALPNFAHQIAGAESGKHDPVIHVGNLNAERDFTDVRDVVRAYQSIITAGQPGEAYNVCSGKAHSIRALLDKLCEMSHIEVTVQVDEDRLRPIDVPSVVGDASKLRQDTAWEPTIDINRSLADILDDARKKKED